MNYQIKKSNLIKTVLFLFYVLFVQNAYCTCILPENNDVRLFINNTNYPLVVSYNNCFHKVEQQGDCFYFDDNLDSSKTEIIADNNTSIHKKSFPNGLDIKISFKFKDKKIYCFTFDFIDIKEWPFTLNNIESAEESFYITYYIGEKQNYIETTKKQVEEKKIKQLFKKPILKKMMGFFLKH